LNLPYIRGFWEPTSFQLSEDIIHFK